MSDRSPRFWPGSAAADRGPFRIGPRPTPRLNRRPALRWLPNACGPRACCRRDGLADVAHLVRAPDQASRAALDGSVAVPGDRTPQVDTPRHQFSLATARGAGAGWSGNLAHAAHLSLRADPPWSLLEPPRARARKVPDRRARLAGGCRRTSRQANHPLRWPRQDLQLSRVLRAGTPAATSAARRSPRGAGRARFAPRGGDRVRGARRGALQGAQGRRRLAS